MHIGYVVMKNAMDSKLIKKEWMKGFNQYIIIIAVPLKSKIVLLNI